MTVSESMPGNSRPLPLADLDHVLEHSSTDLRNLRGARLLVTGGGGFFGRWMLESFAHANRELGLGATATVLTRDARALSRDVPHLAADAAIDLIEGDVRTIDISDRSWTDVLHLATETRLDQGTTASFDTAVDGTRGVLRLARDGGVERFLLASSGAVYGPQPPGIERLDEDYGGAPLATDAHSGYAHGKRAAEFIACAAASEGMIEAKIARGFAFVGPLLPLDRNFAIGNFIRDGLAGGPIVIAGDGTPRRSYLYAADLAIWLWAILMRGVSCRPYNVGSADDRSIVDVANVVAGATGLSEVVVRGSPEPGGATHRYVPSVDRAERELGLRPLIALEDGVLRTVRWYSLPAPGGTTD